MADTISIIGMALSWAAYYALSKWAVDYTTALLAGFLLRLSAFVFLTVYIIIKKKFAELFKYGRTTFIFLLIGLLGYLLDAFANLGFSRSTVSSGAVLLKTDILMACFASAIIFKEKLRLFDWIGAIASLLGAIFVINADFTDFAFNLYDLFFILSALSVTINAFVIKRAQAKGADSDVIAYYNNFTVMLLFLISALIAGDFGVLKTAGADTRLFIPLAAGGLAQTFIYVFYYRNLKVFPVWKVKLFLLAVPVISCLAGIAIFGEKIAITQFFGFALILAGAAAIILQSKFKKPETINQT
ncbi:MAG: DMT family transporter [Christensenellales bacterium]